MYSEAGKPISSIVIFIEITNPLKCNVNSSLSQKCTQNWASN
jgi:hypothetical protein